MKYLIGSKKEFHDFINSIKPEDKIGILTHNDLDGLASGIFLEEILASKKINVELMDFISIAKEMFEPISIKLKEKGITKIFLTDLNADSIDLNGFIELKKNFDVFFIDHHPIIEGDWDKKNVIKNEPHDCTTFVLYDLAKDYFDVAKWDFLVLATMVSEWSFNGEENLKFIIDKCEDIDSKEDIFSSKSMEFVKLFGSAITYYGSELKKAYDLIKEKNFDELQKAYDVVESRMNEVFKEYLDNAQYFSFKKIYFGLIEDEEFVSASNISTRVSRQDYNNVYIVAREPKQNLGRIKMSARCQSGDIDVNLLMRKGIVGLKNALAGGHKKAAAATIMKKDLDKFKENILK